DLYKDFPVYQINKGDKLAQLLIVPIITPELEQVEEFDSESARGEKGFGSSGF
ncbi:dUTP pyrophosphatase, partial [Staphylococcus schleiferi]|nr:dUTP pyrophosphatase [Staphylococcus schleiferi]